MDDADKEFIRQLQLEQDALAEALHAEYAPIGKSQNKPKRKPAKDVENKVIHVDFVNKRRIA